MSLILAVEPDRHRAAQLAAMARAHLGAADLIVSPTVAQAFQSLGERVPDVLLTAPLLPPAEESALDDYLRLIGPAAAHVQSLTIPLLGKSSGSSDRGLLSAFRRDRPKEVEADGCEPSVFASQIAQYLKDARSRAPKASVGALAPPIPAPVSDRTCTPLSVADVEEAVVDLSDMLEDSTTDVDDVTTLDASAPVYEFAAIDDLPSVEAELAAPVNSPVAAEPPLEATAAAQPVPTEWDAPQEEAIVAPVVEATPVYNPIVVEDVPVAEAVAVEAFDDEFPPILEPEPILEPDAILMPEPVMQQPQAFVPAASMQAVHEAEPVIEAEPELADWSAPVPEPTREKPRRSQAMVISPRSRAPFAPAPAQPLAAAAPGNALAPGTVQQIITVPTGNGTTVQTAVNVAVAVSVQVGAAVTVNAPGAIAKSSKPRPVQDEWGFFDPGQCGFQALVARLDQIASQEDND